MDFAFEMDKIEKIVYSNSLREIDWKTTKLESLALDEVVKDLKQKTRTYIYKNKSL